MTHVKKWKRVLVGSIFLSAFFMRVIPSFAEEDPIGFTVEAQQSVTQLDKEKDYFYIKTTPGVEQQVKVTVTGTSEEPVKVKVSTVNGSTSEAGTIDYSPGVKSDSSLKDSIEEITTIDSPEFELKKGEVKTVSITIKPPIDSYEGIKLGTIYFEREQTEEQKKQAIKSSYSYRIGLLLSESDEEYSNSKQLNLIEVKPELKRAKKTIQVTLQNPEPKMIADFSLTASVVEEKSGKVVKKKQLKEGAMAPSSQFSYAIDWGLDPIPAGNYLVKIDAESRYDQWHLEKKFTISAEQAKKMNDETLYKLTLPEWAYWGTGIVAVLLVVDGSYVFLRNRKWKKELIRQTKRKKEKKGRKGTERKRKEE
ncbi:hypothetical protein IGJ55_002753 [Enterococcus sp. AZ170]|uniref:DUF916 and DUF3324 domain-containing protein n=1 Tax=Enterococcus sp. AZ170 TaxID=2774747 RepID=UPI003D2FA7D4